jgi:glycosyltransferase involved in cell wall biosynthesis
MAMSLPAISIILPVYNGAKYLREAISSLIAQTFQDFELIIINDGSTDISEEVVLSCTDSRIIYLINERNKGLVYTLNRGIELAKGKYIARMDADDICVAVRLEKQFIWLEKNAATSVVGCHISFINDDGKVTGEWKEDMKTVNYREIRQEMAWANCVAHPAVMFRAEVIKSYKYNDEQKNTEDYDLWLRLIADGLIIEKIPEKLLLYRVHNASITGTVLRKSNPFFKQFHCKRKFLLQRMSEGKWGSFETAVLLSTIFDGIMGIGKNLKTLLKG